MLSTIAIGGVVLLAALLVFAATKPDTFRVRRAAIIQAPPERIFPLISNLRTFNEWNPFAKHDPSMVITYNGVESGKGAGYAWDGKKGKGRSSITDAASPTRIDMRLDMEKPMEGHPDIVFALAPKGSTTEVSWSMSGPWPYLHRVFTDDWTIDAMAELRQRLSGVQPRAEREIGRVERWLTEIISPTRRCSRS